MLMYASLVTPPMCGLRMNPGSSWNGWPCTIGSTAKLSRPAARTCPLRTAASKAPSSTSPLRAVLTTITPRLHQASVAASSRLRLSSVSGQCSEITSDSRHSVSRLTRFTKSGSSFA